MKHLFNVLKFGWPYLRRYWPRLGTAILLSVVFGLTNASFVWVTKTLFSRLDPGAAQVMASPAKVSSTAATLKHLQTRLDTAIDPWLPRTGRELDWRQVLGGLLILPVMVAFSRYIGYLANYCTNWVSERVIADLRTDVLAKLSSLSLDYFNRSTLGDMLTRINSDTGQLQRFMGPGITDLLKEPITILSVLVALCIVDMKLTLLAVLFLPASFVPLVILGRKVRRAAQKITEASVSQSSALIEALAGIRVVKAFGLEQEQIERFRQYSHRMIHHAMKTVQAKELINPLIETIAMLGLGSLIVCIFFTHTSVPDLVGFLTGVVILFTPVKKLAGLHVVFQQTSVSANRLFEVFREQPTVKESPHARPLSSFATALVFERVSFSYGNQLVLQDINLKIPRGFKLGIAGESGCGKSTLVNLMFRFYDPTAGAITIDGLDLRDAAGQDLRQLMALVSQEIVLFNLSVADNIAFGRPGARRAEIEEAARRAYAHDFILQLPQGYDTRIGERGITLSGGQRQRLCIARAFIRNAPILVLDEATGSLDSLAEAEVQAAIDRLEENRTVVCIAHRLSTLAGMDDIIVLADGRIVERGTFSELLRHRGAFAAMADKQGIKG